MYALGIAYANGFGVEYCPEKAFGYFSKAAEQGIVGASLDLGKMYFHGTGFLQHMVRILTGTLLEVGFGKREADSIPELILAKNRSLAGFTAPAQGLCLMEVDYH